MRFFIKSFGCQMNSYDSLRISDALMEHGFHIANSLNDANIVVLNTCSIREKADEKLFSELGRIAALKEQAIRDGEDYLILVTGCVSQLQSNEIEKRAPYVDIIIGTQDIHRIVSSIENSLKKSKAQQGDQIISIGLDADSKFSNLSDQFYNRGVSEFLTIQEGCDNFCTYCVVPFTRGREFSRDVASIVSEAKKLISLGVKEIVLLGQNVNSYQGTGPDGKHWSLSRLLYVLAELEGLQRIRYLTSNPQDINEDVARAHGEIEILMPFLHLPAQSGSDDILKKMNRKYSVDEYIKCVDMLKNERPDMAFSSDFIVGFPGETDEDFQKTIQFVEKMKYAQAYSFKYSPRPKTAAAKMPNQVPENIKAERLEILQNILNDHQFIFNKKFIGKQLNVLFSKNGRHKNQLVGRSEYSQAVSVCDNHLNVGDLSKIRISETASHSLIGVMDQ